MVFRVTKVSAELDVVIAQRVRPVIYELILAFLLEIWVCGCAQELRVAFVLSVGWNIHFKLGHTAIERERGAVGVGDAESITQWEVGVRTENGVVDAVVAK